jgi:hypothetical protein
MIKVREKRQRHGGNQLTAMMKVREKRQRHGGELGQPAHCDDQVGRRDSESDSVVAR